MFTVNAVTFAIGVTKINRANKKLDELVLTVSEQSTYTLEAFPGVSIIKPLFGADANLESNLETYFNLRYPRYEILFSVQEPGDPALEISTRLSKKYPNISVSFFIGAPKLGLNLKIDNMIRRSVINYCVARNKILKKI
jgi:hypothetical protein